MTGNTAINLRSKIVSAANCRGYDPHSGCHWCGRGGAAAPILAGVATDILADAAITGPVIITVGLFSVEADWGAIEINSRDATIDPDPTVDQSIYKDVAFTPTSMKAFSKSLSSAKALFGLVHSTLLSQAAYSFPLVTNRSPILLYNPSNIRDSPMLFMNSLQRGLPPFRCNMLTGNLLAVVQKNGAMSPSTFSQNIVSGHVLVPWQTTGYPVLYSE
ncbi:hypothetical protein EDC04DRAFT_2600015 [Pisolithus marmoratus]|nr:hypothetical protein EDC04DRAFT_2600015 [Pisolithus marmoratus]